MSISLSKFQNIMIALVPDGTSIDDRSIYQTAPILSNQRDVRCTPCPTLTIQTNGIKVFVIVSLYILTPPESSGRSYKGLSGACVHTFQPFVTATGGATVWHLKHLQWRLENEGACSIFLQRQFQVAGWICFVLLQFLERVRAIGVAAHYDHKDPWVDVLWERTNGLWWRG